MTNVEFEAHVKQLKKDGYTVLPGVLTEKECDAATIELERLAKDKERGGLECIFNKGRIFERIYQLPDLLQLIQHFLGADARLSTAHGRILEPGQGDGNLHADGAVSGHLRQESQAPVDKGRRIISHTMSVNTIFCISKFTKTNGATQVVPGSHRIESIGIPETAINKTQIIEADRGSVIVFISIIWHGTSKNNSSDKRYAVVAPWGRSWSKGSYDLSRIVKPDVLERAGDKGRIIFGLNSRAPYVEHWQWDQKKGNPKPEFMDSKQN